MAEKKKSILALIEVMKRYSDEDHVLSIRQIQNYLINDFGIDLDRRTIYSHMEMLSDYGYEISGYDHDLGGYYLMERKLEKGEVLLLCNAIHASHFISGKQSDQLIKKLLATQSIYQQREFKDKVYMPNTLKTRNKQMMYNIEVISEAIRDGRTLKFTYLRYNSDRKLVPRREEPYVVEPRYIVYEDSRPYMIATSLRHSDFTHYRIDRMADPSVGEEASRPLSKDQDAYEYARNRLFMYNGELETVVFRCQDSVIDQMIDIFGSDLNIRKAGDGTFTMRIRTSATAARYLAQQFMEYITIEEPLRLKEEFRKGLEEALDRYGS